MPPVVNTFITQHTLWQALTGELPPLHLWPAPVVRAALDSRDIGGGDGAGGELFIALRGQHTDGHDYIRQALRQGAGVIICEERGREALVDGGAVPIDCTQTRWTLHAELPDDAGRGVPLGYVVDDAERALQQVGGFQRLHRGGDALRVIGITGSVGKTSTKELTAQVLAQHFNTLANQGNLNNEQGLPLTLMGLTPAHERAVLEMGMYALGEITALCRLARPEVGVVTNVGPSHLSRLGTIERIAQAKSELVQALPPAEDGGVAILNWDDERVRPMRELTEARIFRYGLTSEADLWATDIVSAGMDGIRFQFHYRRPGSQKPESIHVRVPLLGTHSVHTALRAAAVGLVEGLEWDEIVAGLQSISGQLRLVVASGINGSTIVDDTYNASPASTIAALNLLNDLTPEGAGRKVAVLGDMLELGHFTDEGHKLVGRRAAGVVDLLVTVGDLGRAIGAEAQTVGFPTASMHVMDDADEAIAFLQQELSKDDLVLIKGSRAIGMERVVSELSIQADRR